MESRVLPAPVAASIRAPAAEVLEPAPFRHEETGNVPLTDLRRTYFGFSGGLYGEGRNEPPVSLQAAGLAAAQRVVPRDRFGQPDLAGLIGLVAIGPSITRLQFGAFQVRALQGGGVSPAVRLVNGGQDGVMAENWARSSGPWAVLQGRVARSGLSRGQVQAAWISAPHLYPARYGAFPQHAARLAEMLNEIVLTAQRQFPNLAPIYLSSQPYYGYTTRAVHPEPYSYEGAFAVRDVILRQPADTPSAVNTAEGGPPVLLWGPYLWADGANPRSDGLSWLRQDYQADGVHPSASGREKAAQLLWSCFTTDPTARPWFTSGVSVRE
jgi:hypothetical protein